MNKKTGGLFPEDDGGEYRDPEDYRPKPRDVPRGSYDDAYLAARGRGEMAEDKADRVDPGWKEEAYAALVAYAQRHDEFMLEEIPFAIPEGCDPRALGGIATKARMRGVVKSLGIRLGAKFASGKTYWKSLIYTGEPKP